MSKTITRVLSWVIFLNVGMIIFMGCYLFHRQNINHNISRIKSTNFIRILDNEEKFFRTLAYKESGINYKKVNKYGYLGKYQFGEEALVGLGYYTKDGSSRNDWRGKWTGKHGIFSKQDFLNNALIQEIAIKELTNSHWKLAKAYGLDRFVGKTMYGVHVTREGILAAMHLKGPRSVNNFIFYGINSRDAFGTGIKDYMNVFSNSIK